MSSAKQYEIERVENVRRAIAEQLGRPADSYTTDDAWLEAVFGEWAAYLREESRDTVREESLMVIAVQALYAKHHGEKGDLLLAQELLDSVPGLLDPGTKATDKSQTDKLRQKIYRLRGKYGVHNDWLATANAATVALPAVAARPSHARSLVSPDPQDINPVYVRRPVDAQIEELAATATAGNTLFIVGAKGYGKSTLLARYRALCEQHGKRVAFIDLRAYRNDQLENREDFLRTMAEQVGIDRTIAQTIRQPGDLTSLVQQKILEPRAAPTVFFFDHLERLAECPDRSDIVAMLRTWHNNRGDFLTDSWQQTDLIFATAMSPTVLVDDPHFSPFPISDAIALMPLSLEECKKLRDARNAQDYLDDAAVEAMHELVGGIPALVEIAFRRLTSERASERPTWEEVEEVAAEVPGPFQDYLLFREDQLDTAGESGLEHVYRQFVSRTPHSWPREHIKQLDRLQALGLITRDKVNRPIPASPLHVRYFGKKA